MSVMELWARYTFKDLAILCLPGKSSNTWCDGPTLKKPLLGTGLALSIAP